MLRKQLRQLRAWSLHWSGVKRELYLFVRHLKKCLSWLPVCVSNRHDLPIFLSYRKTQQCEALKVKSVKGGPFSVSQVIFHLKKNSFFKTPCTFCFESVDLPAPSACTMLAGTQCLSRRFFVWLQGRPEVKMRGMRCHTQQIGDFVRSTLPCSWPGVLKCKRTKATEVIRA